MAKKTNTSINGVDYYRVRTSKGQPLDKNGKPIPKAFYGVSKKDAEKQRDDYLESLKLNQRDIEKNFVERFDKWLNIVHAMTISESSLMRYLNIYNKWIVTAPYAHLKVTEVESIDIQEHLNKLKPTVAERVYNLLSTFFKYCLAERFISYSPLLTVNVPKRAYSPPKKDVLTREDVTKLNEIFTINTDLFVFKFALYTGMRVSEICALTHNDIDLVNKIIIVNKSLRRIQNKDGGKKTKIVVGHTKTEDGNRLVPIYPDILMNLRTHMVSEENKHIAKKVLFTKNCLLFTNQLCMPLRADKLNDRFKSIQSKYGIQPVNFHKMRATFATMLADAGTPMKTVAEIIGDKDLETVSKYYTKVDLQAKTAAVKNVKNFTNVI